MTTRERKISNDEIMEYIVGYLEKNMHAPTYQDILDDMGFKSKSHVFTRIKELQELGLIRSDTYAARSIFPVGYRFISDKEYNELLKKAGS